MLRSVAIALTLLLHACVFVWLTLPALPWAQAVRSTTDDQPLRVTFIKLAASEPTHAPADMPPSSQRAAATHAETLSHSARASRTSSTPAKQQVQTDTPSTPVEPPPAATDNPEPPETPYTAYGNSNFGRALNDSQNGSAVHLPGDDEPVKVPGLHVETPPSLAQRVSAIGHVLGCKDALFKGRMTDEELAKRGLTERQMLMKFVAMGCH
jgi:hypothetical protein